MLFVVVLVLILVLPIILASAYEAYRKRQVDLFSTSLGLLGVVLVLFGSMVMVPYTATETINNRSHGYTVWADDSLTLQPYTNRSYALDLIRENRSLVYVKVEKATNSVFFIIGEERYFEPTKIITKTKIPPVTPPERPFEYFWTPSRMFGGWLFIFDNPYNRTTNITVKILCYNYNAEWQEKVTRYAPVIHPNFAYIGIASIIVGIGLNLYETKHREKGPKLHQ